MTIKDTLEETYSALFSNKTRTGLTMLGIIIGIGSVIAMTAIGTGAQNSISESIQSIGSNLIVVYPGAPKGAGETVRQSRGNAKTLTLEDLKALEVLDNVKAVAGEVSSRYQVVTKGANTNTTVDGITPSYTEVKNLEIAEGDFISEQNNTSRAKVAVIGPTVLEDLFGEEAIAADVIGQKITINSIAFKIIGVTVEKGGTGMSNADDMVYIPLLTAQHYLSGDKYLSSINVSAINSEVTTQLQEEITSTLLAEHDIDDSANADFSTMNQADILATATSMTSTFTILLAAIAGISLLVGGIGIMNMMLTTVTERTREIGLRKAIGAKRKDISRQFLLEAVMLTFIGGVIGVLFGWLIAFIMTEFDIITAEVSISSVFLAFGVSAFIGIIFGYYPASRASKLNPIDALRYE